MKKTIKWIVVGLVALLFLGTFIFLYQKSIPEETTYKVNTAIVQDIEKTTVITGKIEPRDEVNIKPQISGIIAELYKEAGDMVKKDEVIAKVKVIPDMSSLSSAENRVRLASITLHQAQTDFNRMKNLHEEKIITTEEYEKSEVTLRNAQTEMANAKDALSIVRDGISTSNTQMSTTLIRSTIDGLVLDIPVKIGNSVILSNSFNAGTTIATVANMQDLIFRGKMDETEVGRVSTGMKVQIIVGALPNLKLPATLEYISPKGVEENGANIFEIKAAITLPKDVELRAGYSANATIVLDNVEKAVCVPEASIEFDGDSTFVYVLTDSVDGQKFERRPVTTGISDGVHIEVKKGLKAGTKVRGIENIK